MRLRTRMFLLFGGTAAVLFAVVSLVRSFGLPFLGIEGEYQHALRRSIDHLNLVADLKKDRLNFWLAERRKDVTRLAASEPFRFRAATICERYRESMQQQGDPAAALRAVLALREGQEASAIFRSFIETYLAWDMLCLADGVSGEPVLVEPGDWWDRLPPAEVLLAARSLPRGGGIQVVWSADNNHCYVAFSCRVPAPNGGPGPTAVLVALSSTEHFVQPMLYTGGGLGRTGEVVLVDAARRLLAPLEHPLPNGREALVLETHIAATPAVFASRAKEGLLFASDYRGKPVVAAHRYLQVDADSGWGMVVKQDREELLWGLRKRLLLSTAVGSAGVTVMVLAALVLSTQLTKPLRILSETAAAVRQGDLTARVPVGGDREFRELAAGFNAMITRLAGWQEALTSAVHERTAALQEEIRVREQAEEALKSLKQQMEFILGATKTGIDIIDSEFNIRYIDPEWQKVYGDPTGRKCYEYFMGRDDVCPGCGIVKALETKRITVTEEVLPKENNRPILVTTMPFQNEEGEWLVAEVNVDIAERKEAEAALRASEERYRALVESSAEHLYMLSPEGEYLASNDRVSHLALSAGAELIGKRLPDVYSGEALEVIQANLTRVVRTHQAVTFEHSMVGPDGQVLHHLDTFYPIMRDEKLWAIGGICKDITELRKAQEQFLQAQKMEAVGRLAGGVAHDFNNILTGIKGYLEFALEAVSPDSQAHSDLQDANDLADRAAGVAQQLLAFSRRQTLVLEVLDLNVVVGEASRMLKRLLGEDIALEFVPAPALGSVKADANQVVQILMNLCINARDAMPQGGTLTVETANVQLGESQVRNRPGLAPGAYVLVAVSDTGAGMDEETRAHLFEPFFTTKPTGKGTGLGLATVYGIVKQHGGHVGVYSEPGVGTTFRIYLPRVDEPPAATELPAIESLASRGETILLVEDEEPVLKVAQRVLSEAGYGVLSAGTPAQAVELAARHEGEIALLLTDVVLPGENGRKLYERLRRTRPGLKALFMSGYTDNAIAHHGVLDPGVPFIAKPFTAEGVLRAVRRVLDASTRFTNGV